MVLKKSYLHKGLKKSKPKYNLDDFWTVQNGVKWRGHLYRSLAAYIDIGPCFQYSYQKSICNAIFVFKVL